MGVLSLNRLFVKSFAVPTRASRTVFVSLLIPCCLTLDFRAPPLIPDKPFIWAWNAPTESCVGKFNEPLDMSPFSLTGSPKKGVTGQGVTIFYANRLGYYPHIVEKSQESVFGGIPQLGSLEKHLEKAKKDILFYMPTDNIGLAVIDWEDWRPTWERNWSPKTIYRKKSIELVQQKNAQLNRTEATKIAKTEFEMSGKSFMQETLKLAKSLRPNHFWGFYLFPDCYNHNYKKPPPYTGKCPDIEKKRNENMFWLWKESTALFPSIYLNSNLQSTSQAALFARNRVQEAIRVAKMSDSKSPIPVFVYTRLVFTDLTTQFLSQEDLVNTIGETIALGASGIVIWGTFSLARSMKSCLSLHDYMKTTLNPYLINVTLAAKMCSQVLCKEKGMCVRKNWDSFDYLHLNPKNFEIQTGKNRKYTIKGKPTLEDLKQFSEKFHCSCYPDLDCKENIGLENIQAINVCAFEDICIDINFDSQFSGQNSHLDEESPLGDSSDASESGDANDSMGNSDVIDRGDTGENSDVGDNDNGEGSDSSDSSESSDSRDSYFKSSATVFLPFPRRDITVGLLILCMYSKHLKYLV